VAGHEPGRLSSGEVGKTLMESCQGEPTLGLNEGSKNKVPGRSTCKQQHRLANRTRQQGCPKEFLFGGGGGGGLAFFCGCPRVSKVKLNLWGGSIYCLFYGNWEFSMFGGHRKIKAGLIKLLPIQSVPG